MLRNTCLLLIIHFILLLPAVAQEPALISLANELNVERVDELIVISRKQLSSKLGQIGEQYVLLHRNQRPVLVQYDDLDKDGQWDEIAFLESFAPNEKKSYKLSLAASPATIKAVVRAHARHMRKGADDHFGNDLQTDSIPAGQAATDLTKQPLPPFLTEGPAWENDKVGFRIYFDVRNGKDIWGKTTPSMVLDTVGSDPKSDYHKLAPWGMDILKVGKSLGAGSLALRIKHKGVDTLVRLGGINMGRVVYEKIADGPIRAIFRLRYPEWKIMEGAMPAALTEEIQISGGQYFYSSSVRVLNAPKNACLTTGIVNLHSNNVHVLKQSRTRGIFTFDKQTENSDELGIALMMNKNDYRSHSTTKNKDTEVQNTYTIDAQIRPDKPINFRFYSGWERSDDRFKSLTSFDEFMKKEAIKFQSPIGIQ